LQFLSSLHLGIVLIALVAVGCIAGSLIASNDKLGVDYGREYVFHTWWFLGLMGLLLVNLCLCSWEKSYIALTLYKKRNFQKNPKFYEKAGHAIAFPWHGDTAELEAVLKNRYTVTAKSGKTFYSQKGLFGRAGATIIHIGLLWTMAAGFYRILADDFGWGVYDATVILPEGQSSNLYVTRRDRLKQPSGDNLKPVEMPFSLRAIDFNADYFPHSTVAKSFASLVELTDGGHRGIYEVTMENPLLYKGYKVTQNSFNPNERIQRGKFRVTDTKTGDYTEIDTIPGDPVKLRGLDGKSAFVQVDALAADANYHILDLVNNKIIETGKLADPEDLPLPIDTRPFAAELEDSRYSMMVAALFPNFILDENNQPTTQDEKFENPAVMVMLFKNGRPNGYTWLFLDPEAQKIVGQPHPEVEITFNNYRRKTDAPATDNTLYNYEVELKLKEKLTAKDLGSIWIGAGELKELQVSPKILQSANVRMDRLDTTHADIATSSGSELTTATESLASAEEESTTSTESATAGRYQVEFMGMVPGHVTFLGFMKDPSVGWIFAGCIIIIAGTLIAFILVYRETWCYYNEENGLLYMATAVRGTSPAAHREFDRLVQQVKNMHEPGSTSAPLPRETVPS